ncbi:hypothetical protein VNO80_18714 [Phaseolus coccineus]|uniref:Uncharacterized protein n=1 Tax=Phaseolus coccineus TaxID=3886 RepID=A0AAN9QWP6_PHACN
MVGSVNLAKPKNGHSEFGGHINPLLRLAKFLAAKGFFVTFSTAEIAGKLMRTANNISHKSVTPVGEALWEAIYVSRVIKEHAEAHQPISCIINNPFVPWVSGVAAEHAMLLWVQSAAVFTAYYILKYNEVPDFLHPFSPCQVLGTVILEQFKNLSKPFCVLVDSFEELECDYINYLSKLVHVRPVGPLIKTGTATNTSDIRGDFMKSDDCIEWLNSKAAASVVYISFGSIVCPPQEQVTEIAHGLLDSKISFLWQHRDQRRPLHPSRTAQRLRTAAQQPPPFHPHPTTTPQPAAAPSNARSAYQQPRPTHATPQLAATPQPTTACPMPSKTITVHHPSGTQNTRSRRHHTHPSQRRSPPTPAPAAPQPRGPRAFKYDHRPPLSRRLSSHSHKP